MIVATLDRSGQQAADLLQVGVPRDKLFPLRKEPEPAPKRARSHHGSFTLDQRQALVRRSDSWP